MSCKELTAQRSHTELAAVLAARWAACQALVPAAQGMFAGMEVFSCWAARLVRRPLGSKTKKTNPPVKVFLGLFLHLDSLPRVTTY